MKLLHILLLWLTAMKLAAAGTDTLTFATTPDGEQLTAAAISLPTAAANIYVSPDNRYMALLMPRKEDEDKGTLMLYDQNTDKVKWSIPLNTTLYGYGKLTDQQRRRAISRLFDISLTRHGVLFAKTGDSHLCLLDYENGKKRWDIKLQALLVSDSLDIVLGYKTATGSKVQAYRISTGQLLWEGKVKHTTNWGWDDMTTVNDTTLLVVADDLQFIDVKSGRMLKYSLKTGVTSGSAVLAQIGMGLLQGVAMGAMGAMAGMHYYTPYYVPYVQSTTLSRTCSNVVHHEGRYYVADRDSLLCLDANADKIWGYEFPPRTASFSRLFQDKQHIYMLNYGFALLGGQTVKKSGRPFLASFDAETGEQLSFCQLSMKKDNIERACITPQGAFLMFDDGLAYQLLNDSVVNIKPWDSKAYGQLTSMPADTLYAFRKNDEVLTPLHYDQDHCIVTTDKGKMLVVGRDLEIKDDYQAENVYWPIARWSNDVLTGYFPDEDGQQPDYWIVHESGLPKAHLTIDPERIRLQGSMLYMTYDTKVLRWDTRHME